MDISIKKKFNLYNTLFLNLSYKGANDIGHLIPLVGKVAKEKLAAGMNPVEVFDSFYEDYADMIGDTKMDFMFKVIQYVERQIVLFDSLEDSISPYDLRDGHVHIETLMSRCQTEQERHQLISDLNDFSLRLVFTAHPTQFYSKAVLTIISKLRKLLRGNNMEEVDQLLHQLGLTSLVNAKSPTPIEEAKSIIHICRYEYYQAIGDFVYHLSQSYPDFSNEDLVVMGFWPCGDRDGNPYVTHETTKEVMNLLRMTLMKCYYNDVKKLKEQLTFKQLEPVVAEVQAYLYTAMFDEIKSVDYKWLVDKVGQIRKILIEKYQGLYLADLDRFICKLKVFKTHFLSLDIRQDHGVHETCVERILQANNIIDMNLSELDYDQLVSLLVDEFVDIPVDEDMDGLVLDTVKNIRQLPDLQALNGTRGCHRYIISNSEDIFSVLFVFGLFRWIHKTEEFSFDIIPLFETMNGMNASKDVMTFLYVLPKYSAHLERRNKEQTIMLGFSDGTKDGGYLKANWSIYKCKETLSKVSKTYDVDAIFFDGRGGPPARGGGKTHDFYASRGPAIANNDIQLTIQGQTITSTYGTQDKFAFNAEQMITSGLVSLNAGERTVISSKQRALIEELSDISFQKYDALKKHPKFLPYLENMTTLKYYGRAKIGSRPGKRNKSKKLTLSDLRAISFVGSWSQLKQNIPGYFGLGTACQALANNGRMSEMQDLYQEVPLFKTLLDNSMMSLTKCYFELTAYMKADKEFGEFWSLLHQEYQLSKKMLLEVAQLDTLMENESRTKQSIRIRDEIVRPLLLVQHYAFQKLNDPKVTENRDLFEKLVVRSLYGNINASRNSA